MITNIIFKLQKLSEKSKYNQHLKTEKCALKSRLSIEFETEQEELRLLCNAIIIG